MSRGRTRHQSSRRRMYSGRQHNLREHRARQEWDAPVAFDQDGAIEADDAREPESQTSWSIHLNARASAA